MSFFILKVSDMVFTSDKAEKLMELLSEGTPVTQSWKTKHYEIGHLDYSNVAITPFPAAAMAEAILTKEENTTA